MTTSSGSSGVSAPHRRPGGGTPVPPVSVGRRKRMRCSAELTEGKAAYGRRRGREARFPFVLTVIEAGACSRQRHPKGRSAPEGTLDGDAAAELLGDLATDGETQPRAFIGGLRREEGLEDSMDVGFRNAG